MTRHYSPHSPYRSARRNRSTEEPYSAAEHPGHRHYADSTVGLDTYRGYADQRPDYGTYRPSGQYTAEETADSRYDDGADYEDYEDYEDYDAYVLPVDSRWKWIAGGAAAILLVAVICTFVILGGGDSGSVSATVGTSAENRAPAPTATAAPPQDTVAPSPPPVASLSPETVTTVTPTAPAPTESAVPEAPSAVAPPPPAATPREITYTVTGNPQIIDFVTVIYTDQQGALQTEVNVTLPWSKTVVLDPGVELKSVTATSVGGQLNCAITDAAGTALVSQNNNSMIATCTQ
ncbi:MmpS family transport accessory protein [Mycobacterium sp. GA-2829]|uniref:MmpS family transport accessory protein n=1 Tax=Mycobacterium sp. GA-2829 TaxID=1772283 RepID=UPI00073FBD7A|nr:MmpS family transport accessory protein [Mycobacterium sp. GA-2829]KUI36433.1 hypothetical protein AU194_08035 [Mycobacterium sp. GA-2829]